MNENRILDLKTFSNRLSSLINSSDETTYSLAEKLGLTPATISRYSNGLMKPKIPTVISIAEIFNVNEAWLMGYDVPMKPKVKNFVPLTKIRKIPLLGKIACGEPILAEANVEEYLVLPDKVKADFCLQCKGDSMTGAGINDGDIAYVKQQPTVENGELAAVLIGDEATLKKFFQDGDKVILQPENPKYAPFVYVKEEIDNLRIIGKVVAVLNFK